MTRGNCDDGFEIATDFLLHTKIQNVECLGEEIEGTGAKIFKDYEARQDRDDYVQSDCDPEILFNIKFNGDVKLKSIIVIGGDDDLEPVKLSYRVHYIQSISNLLFYKENFSFMTYSEPYL